MRRVPLWLTGLILLLALAACGAGRGHPAVTASHAGQIGGGSAGRATHVSPGWRIAQTLPSEPGSGEPGGGYTEMLSVAAAGTRDAWAVGDICPQPGDARCHRLLVEHWAGASWRTIPPRQRSVYPADRDQREFGHQRLGLRRHGRHHDPRVAVERQQMGQLQLSP